MPNETWGAVQRNVRCPQCGGSAGILTLEYDIQRQFVHGYARCERCLQSETVMPVVTRGVIEDFRPSFSVVPLDFPYRAAMIDIMTERRRHEPEQQPVTEGDGTLQVFVVTEGLGADLCVVSVFTNRIEAIRVRDSVRYGKIVTMDVANPPKETNFDAYLLSSGGGADYKIHEIVCDKREASEKARALGGFVSRYRITPGLLQQVEERVCKYFVVIDQNTYRHYDNTWFHSRAYAGEEVPYKVTHRRQYASGRDLPHRLEVVGKREGTVEEIAQQLSQLTSDEVCAMFEYNVDYTMVKNDMTNKWEKESCYDVVEVSE